MTRARLNDPPALDLPEPVKAHERAAPAVTARPEPTVPVVTEPTLVDVIRGAAERGTVGRLPSTAAPNLIALFSRTGFHQRDGVGPAACTGVAGRATWGRVMLDVTRPGYLNDRPTLDVDAGNAADLSNPRVVTWLRDEVANLRHIAKLPTLIIIEPELTAAGIDAELRTRLEEIAQPGVCVVIIDEDASGFEEMAA